MSKKIKNLITRELTQRLDGIESLGVINPRGINAVRTNLFRRKLHANNLRMTVVKNTLVRRAVQSVADSKLKGFDALLDGPSAVIYGQSSISQLARFWSKEEKGKQRTGIARHLLRRRNLCWRTGCGTGQQIADPRRGNCQCAGRDSRPGTQAGCRGQGARRQAGRGAQDHRRKGGWFSRSCSGSLSMIHRLGGIN